MQYVTRISEKQILPNLAEHVRTIRTERDEAVFGHIYGVRLFQAKYRDVTVPIIGFVYHSFQRSVYSPIKTNKVTSKGQ